MEAMLLGNCQALKQLLERGTTNRLQIEEIANDCLLFGLTHRKTKSSH
jgi:hypothetical protein